MTGLSLERTSGQLCHLLCIPRWPTFPLICSLNWKPVVSFFLYGSSLGISVSKTSDSLCIQILCWKLFYLLLTFDDSHKKVSVAQSFPTLCNPMDYSPPGFSVHGILQARILDGGLPSFPSPEGLPNPGIKFRSANRGKPTPYLGHHQLCHFSLHPRGPTGTPGWTPSPCSIFMLSFSTHTFSFAYNYTLVSTLASPGLN